MVEVVGAGGQILFASFEIGVVLVSGFALYSPPPLCESAESFLHCGDRRKAIVLKLLLWTAGISFSKA